MKLGTFDKMAPTGALAPVGRAELHTSDYHFHVHFADDASPRPGELVIDGRGPEGFRLDERHGPGSEMHSFFLEKITAQVETDPALREVPKDVLEKEEVARQAKEATRLAQEKARLALEAARQAELEAKEAEALEAAKTAANKK